MAFKSARGRCLANGDFLKGDGVLFEPLDGVAQVEQPEYW
jgi:hypothetical protein